MERFALLVDAGYFFAAGTKGHFGKSLARHDVRLSDPARVVRDLHIEAAALCGDVDLLRVYWYDAMPGPTLSPEQSALALQSGLKLRLGVLNSAGQQKGVDSLIVTDLIELARNRAVSEAVLMSGDEDVRLGVEVAQSFGLRVHLLGAGDTDRNVSRSLRMEADSFKSLDAEWFSNALEDRRNRSDVGSGSSSHLAVQPVEGETLVSAADRVSRLILVGLDDQEVARLSQAIELNQMVPPEYDGKLIATTARALGGRKLSSSELRETRGAFVTVVRELADGGF